MTLSSHAGQVYWVNLPAIHDFHPEKTKKGLDFIIFYLKFFLRTVKKMGKFPIVVQSENNSAGIKILIAKRLIDARVLLNSRRYPSAIYMSGYALELAFKYGICRLMKFTKGFPENRPEFDFIILIPEKSC